MRPTEYRAAQEALEWTNEEMAHATGVGWRTAYRYAAGDVGIPEPAARLVRLLVLLRFTVSKNKFDEMVGQIYRKRK